MHGHDCVLETCSGAMLSQAARKAEPEFDIPIAGLHKRSSTRSAVPLSHAFEFVASYDLLVQEV